MITAIDLMGNLTFAVDEIKPISAVIFNAVDDVALFFVDLVGQLVGVWLG